MNQYDPVKNLDRIVNAAVLRIGNMESDELYSTIVREAIVAAIEAERELQKAGTAKAIAEAREGCAQICDEEAEYYRSMIPNMKNDSIVWHHGAAKAAAHLARKIRARSEGQGSG